MSVSPPEPDEALTCLSRLASSAGELHQYVAELTRLMSAPAGSYAQAVPLDRQAGGPRLAAAVKRGGGRQVDDVDARAGPASSCMPAIVPPSWAIRPPAMPMSAASA